MSNGGRSWSSTKISTVLFSVLLCNVLSMAKDLPCQSTGRLCQKLYVHCIKILGSSIGTLTLRRWLYRFNSWRPVSRKKRTLSGRGSWMAFPHINRHLFCWFFRHFTYPFNLRCWRYRASSRCHICKDAIYAVWFLLQSDILNICPTAHGRLTWRLDSILSYVHTTFPLLCQMELGCMQTSKVSVQVKILMSPFPTTWKLRQRDPISQ